MGEASRQFRELTKEQKAAFVLVLVLGASGVILGFLSLSASVRRPIDEQIARAAVGYLTPSQRDLAEEAALKTRDTDLDGLTDYDESKVYRTSAYLKDSDSDGTDDRTEVMAGNDPNCPTGKQCVASSTSSTPSPASTPSTSSFRSDADLLAYLEGLPALEIRAALIQAGVPEETLTGLSDEDVRALFVKTVKESLAKGELSGLVEPTTE